MTTLKKSPTRSFHAHDSLKIVGCMIFTVKVKPEDRPQDVLDNLISQIDDLFMVYPNAVIDGLNHGLLRDAAYDFFENDKIDRWIRHGETSSRLYLAI